MADEQNKDIVGARINLDTSKMLPAFQKIDEGVKKNVESFKQLNQQLADTAKSYESMAKAADKLALTADERRKKILAESEALVSQRNAQAAYYNAKATAIDGSNQLIKARLGRQAQIIEQADKRMEMEQERHNAKMKNLSDNGGGAVGTAAQYMLAGTLYYKTIQGAQEAIGVIKDYESTIVGLQRVMSSTADMSIVSKSMIADAKEYGYSLKEVGKVYVDVAQQGFDEKDTAMLAKTALMAKNVEESFKDASEAQQLLTGAVLNYNMAAKDSAGLLDKINQVSNDYATDSKKLLEGINGVGAAAHNAGVPIDQLIGYLTVLNQAGFSGSVAGNAIKSFISFTERDVAINKLEKYVGTIKQATGEMMPFSQIMDKIAAQWKALTDVQRTEITQAVARGDQASRFIALMDNYSKTVDVATTAENSFGSAQRENAKAMSTLEKQSSQLRASWEALMVSIGDSGLLAVLKAIVHESKLLVDGFNSLPDPIRNTLVVTLSLGAAILTLNTGMKLLTGQSLVQLATGLVTAARSMMGLTVATETATVAQRAFITTPIGAALTALAVVIGAVTIAWSHHNGALNETKQTLSDNQREAFALGDRYKELKAIVDDNTKSDKEITAAKTELSSIIDQISTKLPNLVTQWDAHGKAIDVNIAKLDEWKQKYSDSVVSVERTNISRNQQKAADIEKEIASLQDELKETGPAFGSGPLVHKEWEKRHRDDNYIINSEINAKRDELEKIQSEINSSASTIAKLKPTDVRPTYAEEASMSAGTGLAGNVKTPEEEYKQHKDAFEAEMNNFHHLVNMKADGYKDAAGQLSKLQDIRARYSNLHAEDLYNIDEEIFRTSEGKAVKAEGFGTAKVQTEYEKRKASFDTTMNLFHHLVAIQSDGYKTAADQLQKLKDIKSQFSDLNDSDMFSIDESIFNTGATLDKELKDAADKILTDSYNFSEKWIAHQKAIGQLSEREEYEAQLRVQSRYEEGTELRKQADEQVYAAKKALMDKEQSALDDYVSKEKQALDQSKKNFNDAQDAKIRKIEDQIKAQDIANSDADYNSSLAEKQARMKALQAGVGPEAIKERQDLQKEIDKMVLDHNRELNKRDLESQKQKLEDEKTAQNDAYDKLIQSLETFKGDANGIETAIKDFRIQANQDANSQILKDLDTFITQYKQKQASITSEGVDLQIYNSNIDKWYAANAKGDQSAMDNAHAENEALRKKYGIPADSGKLQHFADGGIVRGSGAVPVVAHGGEMFLNASQQLKLFDMIRFHMPSIQFQTPKSIVNNYYSFDNSVGSVAVQGGNGVAGLYDQRTGLITRQQALGGKVR
jgi:TP901 family phage tail tape measure protein